MKVRLARRDDLPALVAINTWAIENTTTNFAHAAEPLSQWQASYDETHRTLPWFVADDQASIVGFAKASPWKSRSAYQYACEISVYVHHEHHRRGIGRALYRQLLGTLTRQGYHTAYGGIVQPNEASVRLHESLGMKRVALFPRVGWKFGAWHDIGYWQARLRDDGPPVAIRAVLDVVDDEGVSG